MKPLRCEHDRRKLAAPAVSSPAGSALPSTKISPTVCGDWVETGHGRRGIPHPGAIRLDRTAPKRGAGCSPGMPNRPTVRLAPERVLRNAVHSRLVRKEAIGGLFSLSLTHPSNKENDHGTV